VNDATVVVDEIGDLREQRRVQDVAIADPGLPSDESTQIV
jgi:hypothetical protein